MEHIFPHIRKPLRYIGNEIGAVHKDWNQTPVKFALSYPDLYEIGMSSLGIRIIYSLLNSREDTLCERCFAPALDLEQALLETNTPLFSMESGTPLKKFDCIGFSLKYELTYTNVLNMLKLSQVPIYREARGEADSLIIAGGSCTSNPAPIARFFDCLFIGEAEQSLSKFIDLVREWKNKNLSRQELLEEVAEVQGIFVPGVSKKATRGLNEELQDKDFPETPVLPFIETTHDSLVVEIARGCTRGCRFCQAGMISRPYKERPMNAVIELVKTGIQKTGYEAVSLLSLSAGDHSELIPIVKEVRKEGIEVELPSLRGDALTPELASLIGRGGLTIAPETGTERLRERVNKPMQEDRILNSCELAVRNGFTHIKLYYMLGLPGETQQDIDGIAELTRRISKVMNGKRINISLSPFVPRPHTPFQWEAQEQTDEVERKIKYIKSKLRYGNIKIKYRAPLMAMLEGICARGDEKIADVLEEAWKNGAKFDGWSDQFNFGYWEKAFQKLGIKPYAYLNKRKVGTRSRQDGISASLQHSVSLPWDQIDMGVKKNWLKEEGKKQEPTLDCRITGCYTCGACDSTVVKDRLVPIPSTDNSPQSTVHSPQSTDKESVEPEWSILSESSGSPHEKVQSISYGRSPRRKTGTRIKLIFRVKFEKREELRFLGHLDLVRAITRAIKRANIPIIYSQGFTKRPNISFSPPLPFGITSREEYFDICFESPPHRDIKAILNFTLPEGLQVLEVSSLLEKEVSLFEKFKKCKYSFLSLPVSDKKIQEFMAKGEILVHSINIRPAVLSIVRIRNDVSLHMQIGKVKPWWVISALLGVSEDDALDFKIERIGYIGNR